MPRIYYIQPEEFDLLLGETMLRTGRSLHEGEEATARLLDYAERSGDSDLLLIAHAEISGIFLQYGLFDRMQHHLDAAASIAADGRETPGRVIYELYLGLATIHGGKYGEGAERYAEAERIARSLGMPMLEAWTRYGIGTAALRTGDRLAALESGLAAQRLANDVEPETLLYGFASLLVGTVCAQCNLIDRALESYARADRALAKGSGTVRGLAAMQRGRLYAEAKQWEEAHRYFDTAFGFFTEAESRLMLCGLYSSRAFAFQEEGRYAEARTALDSALELARTNEGVASEMEILNDLARLEEAEGNIELAISYLRSSLAHHREYGNRWGELMALVRLSRCLKAQGNFEEASRMLEQQLTVQHAVGVRTAPSSMLLLMDREGEKGREREIQHLRVQQEMLEEEMRRKMSELSEMALRLRKRDELLATLEQRLRSGIEQAGASAGLLHELHSLVAEGAGGSWTDFSRQVDDAHSEFVRALAARNPTLTPTELKVCCLLRVNLSTKEIARLLGITGKSVELYRSRIRRKLAIDSAIHLPSALLAM